MASRLKAVNTYRPRILRGNTVQKDELLRYVADRTGLNEGTVDLVLSELRDAIIFFGRAGRGVKIEGIGVYLPNVKLDGSFKLEYRLASELKDGLNTPGTFSGTIENKDNIGKSTDELVALWNTEHPDDPVA